MEKCSRETSEIEVDTGIATVSGDYTDQFLQADSQSGEGDHSDGEPDRTMRPATRRHAATTKTPRTSDDSSATSEREFKRMHQGLCLDQRRKNSPETNMASKVKLEPAGNRCEQRAKLSTDTSIQRRHRKQHEQQARTAGCALCIVRPDSRNQGRR